MSEPDKKPVVIVEIYKARPPRFRGNGRRQPWRWRAFNYDNRRTLASGESFANYQDCIDSLTQLFGTGSNVYLWKKDVPKLRDQTSETLRMATDA